MRSNRQGILDLGVKNFGDEAVASDSEEDVKKPMVKTYADVPVLDFMKGKMSAIMQSYSQSMKDTIELNMAQAVPGAKQHAKSAANSKALNKIEAIKAKAA